MKRTVMGFSFITMLLVGSLAAIDDLQPIPSNLIQSGMLTSDELNFTVANPKLDWIWYQKREGPEFILRSTGGQDSFTIKRSWINSIDMMSFGGALTGLGIRIGDSGGSISEQNVKLTSIPIPGSGYVSYRETLNNGSIQYKESYFVPGRPILQIEYISNESGENPAFTEFIKSFKRIRSEPARQAKKTSTVDVMRYELTLAVGILLLSLILSWLINRITQRSLLNGYALGIAGNLYFVVWNIRQIFPFVHESSHVALFREVRLNVYSMGIELFVILVAVISWRWSVRSDKLAQ